MKLLILATEVVTYSYRSLKSTSRHVLYFFLKGNLIKTKESMDDLMKQVLFVFH